MQAASTRGALRLLIVDSSAGHTAKLTETLVQGGYDIRWQRVDRAAALSAALSEQDWDLVLCDESADDLLAGDAVRVIRKHHGNPSIIVLSQRPDIAGAVEAMRSGAHDYVRSDDLPGILRAVEREHHEAHKRCARAAADPLHERRYRDLVETSQDITWTVDTAGCCTFTSQGVRAMLGYAPDEIVGRPFTDFLNPNQREKIVADVDYTGQGKDSLGYEAELVRKDGAVVVVRVNAVFLRDGNGRVVGTTGSAIDITERKRVELALRESEARMRAFANAVPDIAFILDHDGRYVEVLALPQKAHLLANRPEEIRGRLLHDLLPQESADLFLALVRRTIETEESQSLEYPLRVQAGEQWFEARTAPLRVAGEKPAVVVVAWEITERKRIEEALRESEAKYRDLVESINDVVFAVDGKGCIQYMSPSIELMTGHKPAEMQGRSFTEFIHPEDVPNLRKSFAKTLHGDLEPSEYRTLPKDGQFRWVRSFSRPVLTGDRVTTVRGVLTDITDAKRAEERARKQHAELAHVLRLNTMGEMAAQLAHEINQPLGAIANFAMGLATRLRNGAVDPDGMRNAAEEIGAQALRAGEIIRRLRSFVRKGDTKREACDLNRAVREAAHLVEPDARGQDIAVRLVLDPDLPPVEVDRVQIQQVLVNLCRNAVEAMAAGPTEHRELLIETSASGEDTVLVQVRDTGVGLAAEEEESIFEPFFTTKADGLGMGLSISRTIIEAQSGRLWAERNLDSGATFRFLLPIAPGAAKGGELIGAAQPRTGANP